MSSFKSYLPQIGASLWEPRCNHSTMARIYHEEFKCDFCRRQSQFGWLYRCTVDKDPLIFGAKSKGVPVSRVCNRGWLPLTAQIGLF